MPSQPRRIAVLTSGGDSQGMNAAIKAIVRIGIRNKCKVFGIFEGFKGLVEGNAAFQLLEWNEVAHIIGQGGTILQTARSEAFFQREGRLKACKNLILNQINSLIVIGGDGSLTGAQTLYEEWPSMVQELEAANEISESAAKLHNSITIVGIAGSIDNDLVGTDSTIGSTTSLHRIIEAIQCIHTTARSHRRSFVVEVMGRKCGWLATMAAVASGADFVFIPERPVPVDWPELLARVLLDKRALLAQESAIIIVAEGAVDVEGNAVKSEAIRNVLQERIGLPARVTVLGHMQRGGTTCAQDRYIGTLQGREAVLLALRANGHNLVESGEKAVQPTKEREILSKNTEGHLSGVEIIGHHATLSLLGSSLKDQTVVKGELGEEFELSKEIPFSLEETVVSLDNSPLSDSLPLLKEASPGALFSEHSPKLVGMSMNKVICSSLTESIEKTRQISQLFQQGQFSQIFSMRDSSFQRLFSIFEAISEAPKQQPLPLTLLEKKPQNNLLIIHTGSPACGMNALTRILTQYGIKKGFQIYGVIGGFPGLAKGEISELRWKDVDHLMGVGGSILGTNRFLFSECSTSQMKVHLEKFQISSVVILGGFEALISCCEMSEATGIPIICIPATVSNNIPGSEFSIGSDSALNVIVEACDKLKQSAASYHNRVFLLEVQGGKCGYLATLGALGGGASLSHIAEEPVTLATLQKDVVHLKQRFVEDRKQGRVIVKNECSSETFSSQVTASILQSEAEGTFDVRCCVLGHLQQGGSPSPLDRLFAAEFAVKAIETLEQQSGPFGSVIGLVDGQICCSDAHLLAKQADWQNRRPKNQWWMWMRSLLTHLSSHAQ